MTAIPRLRVLWEGDDQTHAVIELRRSRKRIGMLPRARARFRPDWAHGDETGCRRGAQHSEKSLTTKHLLIDSRADRKPAANGLLRGLLCRLSDAARWLSRLLIRWRHRGRRAPIVGGLRCHGAGRAVGRDGLLPRAGKGGRGVEAEQYGGGGQQTGHGKFSDLWAVWTKAG